MLAGAPPKTQTTYQHGELSSGRWYHNGPPYEHEPPCRQTRFQTRAWLLYLCNFNNGRWFAATRYWRLRRHLLRAEVGTGKGITQRLGNIALVPISFFTVHGRIRTGTPLLEWEREACLVPARTSFFCCTGGRPNSRCVIACDGEVLFVQSLTVGLRVLTDPSVHQRKAVAQDDSITHGWL